MSYTLAEQSGGMALVVLLAFIVDRIAARIPNVLDRADLNSPVSGDPPASKSGEGGKSGESGTGIAIMSDEKYTTNTGLNNIAPELTGDPRRSTPIFTGWDALNYAKSKNTLDQAESRRAAPPRTNIGGMPDRGFEAARAPGRSGSLRHYNVWSGM